MSDAEESLRQEATLLQEGSHSATRKNKTKKHKKRKLGCSTESNSGEPTDSCSLNILGTRSEEDSPVCKKSKKKKMKHKGSDSGNNGSAKQSDFSETDFSLTAKEDRQKTAKTKRSKDHGRNEELPLLEASRTAGRDRKEKKNQKKKIKKKRKERVDN